jgi:hypothetical protein
VALRRESFSLASDIEKLPVADAPRGRIAVPRFQPFMIDAQGKSHFLQ